jgi:solute:Na+ symporter, SSS family
VSIALLIAARNGVSLSPHAGLLVTVAITTVCWVAAAYLGPQTDRDTLIAFYRKVRPFGPGWERVRIEAGVLGRTRDEDNIPRALLGWFAGCATIWSGLFLIGTMLYGRWDQAAVLGIVLLASGSTLIWVMRHLWTDMSSDTAFR